MLGYCNWCDIQTLLLGLFKPCSELSWYHTFLLISFQTWSIRNLITVYPRSERLNSLLVCQWIGFTSTSYYVGKVDKTSHQLQLACYINRQKFKKKHKYVYLRKDEIFCNQSYETHFQTKPQTDMTTCLNKLSYFCYFWIKYWRQYIKLNI